MASKITYKCFVSIGDAEPIPIDELTEEQIAECEKRMSERLSRNMSAYYNNRLNEFTQMGDKK